MSDTGLTGLRAGILSKSGSASGSGEIAQNAQVLNLPDTLKLQLLEKAEPVRVRGEVERADDDGNLRVRTERGNIEVKVPPETQQKQSTRIQEGSSLSIQISPYAVSSTPDYSVIKYTPSPFAPDTQHAQGQQHTEVRNTSTPVDINVRVSQLNTPQAQPAAPTIQTLEQTLIRLQPITQQQLETIIAAQAQQNITQTSIGLFSNNAATTSQPHGTPLLAPIQTAPAQDTTAQITALTPPRLPVEESLVFAKPLPDSAQTFTGPIPPSSPQQHVTITQATQSPLPDIVSPLIRPELLLTEQVRLSGGERIALLSSSALPQDITRSVQITNPITAALQPVGEQIAPQVIIRDAVQARITETLPQAIALTPPSTQERANTEKAPLQQQGLGTPVTDAPRQGHAVNIPQQRAGEVTAHIIAKTVEGFPVIQIAQPQALNTGASSASVPPQTYIMHMPGHALPIGTQVQFVPVMPQSVGNDTDLIQQSLSGNAALPLPAMAMLQTPWPVLDEIHQVLMQAAPQAAQAFAAQMPNPANPMQFGAAVLFFVSAVRAGDLNSWLGERTIDILRRDGHSKLLGRIAQEGGMLSRMASETHAQDWRGINIPLFYDGEIQKIALHYKHDQDRSHSDDAEGKKGTRFLFDLKFSDIGPVQLDGYFRKHSEDGTRLDLILRTQQQFSQGMHAEMRRLYMNALKHAQISGDLSFQNSAESWVTISAAQNSSLGVSA